MRLINSCLHKMVLILGSFYLVYTLYYAVNISINFQHPSAHLVLDVTNKNLKNDITIITAYFNIGNFQKGEHHVQTPDTYRKWMNSFRYLNNPLIVFCDNQETFNIFREIREHFPENMTLIIKVEDRNTLWAFQQRKKIKRIFSNENYPVFYPNTVNENYSCAMHAKFELVEKFAQKNYFGTKYFAWLDIGIFRHVLNDGSLITLRLPHGFDENKVSFSQLNSFDGTLTPRTVIYQNLLWVCGGMFLGRQDVIIKLVKDYQIATEQLLTMNLMSTDQQVLYSMYLPNFLIKPRVKLQVYRRFSSWDWFYLLYLSMEKDDMLKRAKMTSSVYAQLFV